MPRLVLGCALILFGVYWICAVNAPLPLHDELGQLYNKMAHRRGTTTPYKWGPLAIGSCFVLGVISIRRGLRDRAGLL